MFLRWFREKAEDREKKKKNGWNARLDTQFLEGLSGSEDSVCSVGHSCVCLVYLCWLHIKACVCFEHIASLPL